MLDENTKNHLKARLITTYIIWAGILFSLAIYVGIIQVIPGPGPGTSLGSMAPYILLAVGAVSAGGGLFVRKLLLLKACEQSPGADDLVSWAVGRYNVAVVVSSAMGEVLGILGLVIYLTGGGVMLFYAAVAGSALAVVMGLPRSQELFDLAETARMKAGR